MALGAAHAGDVRLTGRRRRGRSVRRRCRRRPPAGVGKPGRAPSAVPPPPELTVVYPCDRRSGASMPRRSSRNASPQLHERLTAATVSCTRLALRARTERGKRDSRIWCCALPLTPEATAADRVRWQLEGWLGGATGAGEGRTRRSSNWCWSRWRCPPGWGSVPGLPEAAGRPDGPAPDRIPAHWSRVRGCWVLTR